MNEKQSLNDDRFIVTMDKRACHVAKHTQNQEWNFVNIPAARFIMQLMIVFDES